MKKSRPSGRLFFRREGNYLTVRKSVSDASQETQNLLRVLSVISEISALDI